MRAHYEHSDAFAEIRALRDAQRDSAFVLYDRLITAAAPA
jgi:hypothetical protein